jgi:hypothetical protein
VKAPKRMEEGNFVRFGVSITPLLIFKNSEYFVEVSSFFFYNG